MSAPPPLCANVIGAFAPTVARLLSVVADALLLAIFTAAAPAPLVVASPLVTPEVMNWLVLPIPVTALKCMVAAFKSVMPEMPLPWIAAVRAFSVAAFVPVFRMMMGGLLLLVVVFEIVDML